MLYVLRPSIQPVLCPTQNALQRLMPYIRVATIRCRSLLQIQHHQPEANAPEPESAAEFQHFDQPLQLRLGGNFARSRQPQQHTPQRQYWQPEPFRQRTIFE